MAYAVIAYHKRREIINTIIGLIILFFAFRWFLKSEHKLKIVVGTIVSLFILGLISNGDVKALFSTLILGAISFWIWSEITKYDSA